MPVSRCICGDKESDHAFSSDSDYSGLRACLFVSCPCRDYVPRDEVDLTEGDERR